ncbi:MAG: tektin family protein [Nanoarchaeota archaeon]|nr:tektin family protein [Nanoarchaeota archaeon]
MKSQGTSDEDIINRLQQQGVSPKEINDALGQSQIKSAVSDSDTPEGMEPSVLQQGGGTPQIQEMYGQDLYTPPPLQAEPLPPQYAPQQEYYQEGGYEGGYAPEGLDTETMIEVAEQVFSEKIKKLQKQVGDINEFKTLAQTKLENLTERVKKIESIIDKLQISILDKVGSYGKNLEGIKKEMSMMQDSFGKMVKHATTRPAPVHSPTIHSESKGKSGKKK